MKRIGIGLSDFKELIEENYYYFDKTKFIDEIVKIFFYYLLKITHTYSYSFHTSPPLQFFVFLYIHNIVNFNICQ